MSDVITIKRSSYEDEKGGYPVTVSLRGDHAILTIEEAEEALNQLRETLKELEMSGQ